jgi:hypothetical protein
MRLSVIDRRRRLNFFTDSDCSVTGDAVGSYWFPLLTKHGYDESTNDNKQDMDMCTQNVFDEAVCWY